LQTFAIYTFVVEDVVEDVEDVLVVVDVVLVVLVAIDAYVDVSLISSTATPDALPPFS
jgi:hypothetical protein